MSRIESFKYVFLHQEILCIFYVENIVIYAFPHFCKDISCPSAIKTGILRNILLRIKMSLVEQKSNKQVHTQGC